jgi:UDP-N-acetylmuramoyl-L-alanyl-D-glutamate--2,6-diaminopimelate ligase
MSSLHPADRASINAWLQQHAPAMHLSSDSRTVAPGDIFFAYPGDGADGRSHIAHAIANGARAVVYEGQDFAWNDDWDVPHLQVGGLKSLAGPIANDYYAQPDAGMFTVAVTGTNGKTSCSQWLAASLSRLGDVAAVIGTLGVGVFRRGEHDEFSVTGYTTPDALLLQRKLARLRDVGVTALAIEASSIGLHQQRMHGMHVDVGVFTNLTRDHLDYHGDMADYEAAKTMLFDWPGLQHAVINLDDAAGVRLASHLRATAPAVSITGYSVEGVMHEGVTRLTARDIRTSHAGTVFYVDGVGGASQVRTQLIGRFNVSNVLAVIGVLLAKGVEWRDALDAAELLTPAPGRMQQLGGHDAPLVVIDYAHTPDALEKTLATLRKVAEERNGELWCVFGCGGDRDPGKRPQMGAISQIADHVVVTSDNPRSEDLANIMAQIDAGMDAEKTHLAIEDRAAAILWAVRHATRADVILLAGKGHETTQEIKGRKLPFLDADHAALALATRVTMKGGS